MLLNILSNGDKHTSTSVLYVQRYHIRENSESYTECTPIYTGVIKTKQIADHGERCVGVGR